MDPVDTRKNVPDGFTFDLRSTHAEHRRKDELVD
jgi:hypothetical protein